MFETIAHLLGEGFELFRRATTFDAVRRRRDRAYRRCFYWGQRVGRRGLRKHAYWRHRYMQLDAELMRIRRGTP